MNAISSTKCHTGPGCRLHSATGITRVKRELAAAQDKILNASTLEEMTVAKTELLEARKHYDLTEEGRNVLRTEISEETDRNRVLLLKSRLKEAEDEAARLEEEEQELYKKSSGEEVIYDSINFPKSHTYDVAELKKIDDYTFVGSKMTSGYRRVTEINKDIRNDIAEAVKKGYLPEGLTYSVSKESAAWTESVIITVKGLSDKAIYVPSDGFNSRSLSPEAKELNNRLEKIAKAYGSFHSNPMIDSFNNSYYVRVNLEDNHSRKYRKEEAEVRKTRAFAAKQRKVLTSEFDKHVSVDSFKKAHNIAITKTTKDGYSYGYVEGTNFVAFEYERPNRLPNQPNHKIFEVYDFAGVKNSDEILESFDKTRQLLSSMKKNRFIQKFN